MTRLIRAVPFSALVLALCAGSALADPPSNSPATEGGHYLADVPTEVDFTKYRTIFFAPLAVPAEIERAVPPQAFPPVADTHETTERDVRQLRNTFSGSMESVLWRNGLRVVAVPDSHTLIVYPRAVQIVLNPQVNRGRYGIDYILSSTRGSVVLGAVLVDGATRKPVAEIGDREYSANLWGIDPAFVPWMNARDVFDEWASDLSDTLRSR